MRMVEKWKERVDNDDPFDALDDCLKATDCLPSIVN